VPKKLKDVVVVAVESVVGLSVHINGRGCEHDDDGQLNPLSVTTNLSTQIALQVLFILTTQMYKI